jgi:hypothetical protein
MASQKVRPTALRRFFRTSTYLMYAFAPEKPPCLVGRNFCLAIGYFAFLRKQQPAGGAAQRVTAAQVDATTAAMVGSSSSTNPFR